VAEKNSRPARRGRQAQEAHPTAIVGVGVCAASLRSLEILFAALPADLGAAYVVAVRQQEGLTVETVVNALVAHTRLPVTLAVDGERLRPGHILVGGPESLVTFEDGHVRSTLTEQPVGHRGTVDTMLISLAEHGQERSVGIILAGLEGDGTAGVTATKQYGGLSIAESRDGEAEAAEAGASTPAGVVDLLVPVDRIADHVALYVRNLAVAEQLDSQASEDAISAQLTRIAVILRNATGNDFHGYKRNTFMRRVQRRMQVVQIDEIELYVELLRTDHQEVQHLFQDLLIGVTQFFRDPAEFELLEREIPALFDGKGADDQLRVWVIGCATGEEAYSIGIILREQMAGLDAPPQVQIFATDLDARALGLARAGRYSSAIASHVSPERLARWFVREGETYCVAKELREMCIFSPHNLIKDAPFSRIDLLSCRNLLIYLNAELQNRVIPIFHFSLRTGGLLFLGSSENVTRHQKLFAPIDRKKRIFRRVETAIRILPDFPRPSRAGRRGAEPEAPPPPPRSSALSATIARRAEQTAERYAPAYLVIDGDYEVLHFSGRTGRYLEPAAGAASLNLLNLVHRDLRVDLRAALHKAAQDGQRTESALLPLQIDGRATGLRLVVEPVSGPGPDLAAMIVLFQEAGPVAEGTGAIGEHGTASDEHVQRIEAELGLTRERLQATIEELESTNEELKSSNEEYQSINEELQSANEELETSKEELQSVNEELHTVNGELAHRVGDLARTNSDLKNLLESTQIATVFLDNELRIRGFTPAATDIFHLLDTDIGRPIGHVAARIAYGGMEEDVRRVLKTLGSVEREVLSSDRSRHFTSRILPYRSTDNFIAGAVLTFVDITGAVQAEVALRESGAQYQIAVDVGRLGTWDWNIERGDSAWNNEQYRMLGYAVGEVEPGYEAWAARLHPDDFAAAETKLARAREKRQDFVDELRIVDPDGSIRWSSAKARFFYDGDGRAVRMIGIMEDTTERRQAEELQRTLIAELQHRTRNLLSIVRSISQQTLRSSASLEVYGREFGDRLGALSRVQGLLSRRDGFSVTLDELVRGELQAHGAAIDGTRVEVEGPPVTLSSREVQVLTLALHELATNAAKYGALAQPEGQLSVRWSVGKSNGSRMVTIRWAEAGVDMAGEQQGEKRGFGRELIERALPYDLGAETAFELGADGVRCELKVPLGNMTGVPADGIGEAEGA
jgi:two-component system CheB/CheR fusion protein